MVSTTIFFRGVTTAGPDLFLEGLMGAPAETDSPFSSLSPARGPRSPWGDLGEREAGEVRVGERGEGECGEPLVLGLGVDS